MNLFIGVILDGFDAASASDHDVITQEDFARFAHHWAEYDPRATCLISVQASFWFPKFIFRDYYPSQWARVISRPLKCYLCQHVPIATPGLPRHFRLDYRTTQKQRTRSL